MKKTLSALLHSRKVLLALFGAITTIVMHYNAVPPEIWVSIDALVGVLIASIAHEDAAEKRSGGTPGPRQEEGHG